MFKKMMVLGLIAIILALFKVDAYCDYTHEIIVQFREGTVTMPLGQSTADVYNVTFSNNEIIDTLISYSVTSVMQSNPDYDYTDSIIVSPHWPELTAKRIPFHRLFRFQLSDESQKSSLNNALMKFNEVIIAGDVTKPLPASTIPNDSRFDEQWALHNNSTYYDINAPEAWDYETGDYHTIPVIFDFGVYTNHTDLQNKVYDAYSYWDTTDCHGNVTAGIIGAITDNDEGIAGINWEAHIHSFDIRSLTNEGIAIVMDQFIFNDYRYFVVNNSWVNTEGIDWPLEETFAIAAKLGITMVAARGNEGVHPELAFPACYGPHVISVGAINYNGGLSDFSYYGHGMDLLAPGGNDIDPDYKQILSTGYPGVQNYVYIRGTSCAAPHVTGVISLLHDSYGLTTWDNYKGLINSSASDIGDPGYDDHTGWGLLDAQKALEMVDPNYYSFCPDLVPYGDPYVYDSSNIFYCYLRGYGEDIFPYGGYPEIIKVYEVRQDVIFAEDVPPGSMPFWSTPNVWGVGTWTTGYYDPRQLPNPRPSGHLLSYGVQYCDTVGGSVTNTGATLKTYIHGQFMVSDDPPPIFTLVNYYPCAPEDVQFCYSIVGDNIYPAAPTNLQVASTGPPDYHPRLDWDHNTDPDLEGYRIYRRAVSFEPFWVQIGEVPSGTNYYIDTEYCTPNPGFFGAQSEGRYKVSAVDQHDNISSLSPYVSITVVRRIAPNPTPTRSGSDLEMLPTVTKLYECYPNPFNSTTTIEFDIAETSEVQLILYNHLGQLVETLVNGNHEPGRYSFNWNASDYSSGIYFYKLTTNDKTFTKRMTLLK